MMYTHDGNRCNPINLPSMYAKDGLQVRFTGNEIDPHDLMFIEPTPCPYVELTSVELLGDLNGDMKVNSTDAYLFVMAYGSRPGDSKWNPNADLNYDNSTDIADAILLARNYGKQVT